MKRHNWKTFISSFPENSLFSSFLVMSKKWKANTWRSIYLYGKKLCIEEHFCSFFPWDFIFISVYQFLFLCLVCCRFFCSIFSSHVFFLDPHVSPKLSKSFGTWMNGNNFIFRFIVAFFWLGKWRWENEVSKL